MNRVQTVNGQEYLVQIRNPVDSLLIRFTPSEDEEPRSLHAAVRYSLLAGGKRIRPTLAHAAYGFCRRDRTSHADTIHRAMAAIEMIHTYSLIHDDLPCMDDDELRRGMPTCHKKFGEAVAVLAGDTLHVMAFNLMAQTGSNRAVLELAEAVGTAGMLGGQIADIEAEGRQVTRSEIITIHSRKTGALIRASLRIGAILGDADDSLLARFTIYGEKIGLAFQIIDDILDVEGDQEKLGKKVGSDCKNQKATYPGVVGLEQARLDAARLIDEALKVFGEYDDNILQFIARYIGQRER